MARRADCKPLRNKRRQVLAEKLIIDADPGIGDALALALALLDPTLDVVATTACAGCVSGPTATRNVQAVVELVDPPRWPRIGSSSLDAPLKLLTSRAGVRDPAELNGPTGLGDVRFRTVELHRPRDSAKVIVDTVRNFPNQVTLLTLGPLTNVAMAYELAPDLPTQIKRLVCLAGAIQGAGDVTATAEFNVFADPNSARKVLRSPATKVLVPLDVSSKVVLTYDQFHRLANGTRGRLNWLWDELIPFALRAHHERRGVEGFPLCEVVALAFVSRPGLFEMRSAAIDVETKGELTRGMTVCDQRGIMRWQHNIDVLRAVDVQGVLDYMADVLRGGKRSL